MKKSELIQILGRYQPEATDVSGALLYKDQDGEAIQQLKSILKSPQVFNLPNEAILPKDAIEAIEKVIDETTNPDSQTKLVLDGLRHLLTNLDNTAVSSNTSGTPSDSSFRFFMNIHTLIASDIFNWLPAEKQEVGKIKSRRSLFRALASNKDGEYESARQGVSNGMQATFLQYVADADMGNVETILKLTMRNEQMLRALLTKPKTIIQKNRILVTGTALEIAWKCWDTSLIEGGKEGMVEMLMRYMRMLPEGEQLIRDTFTKLFPNGHEAHQQDQTNRAEVFAKSVLGPLAETLKDASDDDIELVYALTAMQGTAFDMYINTRLAANRLWQALMVHHEAIKAFMSKDQVYNPFYLLAAFKIVDTKYEIGKWANLSEGFKRLPLLTIHGVGGVQVCSPTYVGVLFAQGVIWKFLTETTQKNFQLERDCKFKQVIGGKLGDVFAQSDAGVFLCSKKYWGVALDGSSAGGMHYRLVGAIVQTKTRHEKALLRVYASSIHSEPECNLITSQTACR